MLRTTATICALSLALFTAGCAKKSVVPESETEITSARLKRPNVHVSDELKKACAIRWDAVERAPKFAYDDDALMPEDRAILAQLARCVTTGPLKGKKLELTGRADPRGETEYNMILGEHRAASVVEYLSLLGVEPGIMAKTSRGELDAEGTDEDGWARDRRVDIALEAPAAAAAPRAATP